MVKIKTNEIKEDMILAKTVEKFNGTILLFKGAVLKSTQIKKLIDNDIEEIFIEETSAIVRCLEYSTDKIIEEIDASILKKILCDDLSSEIVDKAYEIMNIIVNDEKVSEVIVNIKRNSSDIYNHSVEVAAVTVILAIKAGFDDEELKDVAIGALLHDIALTDIDMEYIDVEVDNLLPKDKLIFRRHVIKGYEIVERYNWVNDKQKAIVLSHHERNNGSGYPFHKLATRIPKEVKIVGLCDYVISLVNGIGYKKRKPNEVIEFLRTNGELYFEKEYIEIMMNTIAWYPVGSTVITTEGEKGIVVSQNKLFADRPVIKIIEDKNGNVLEKEVIKDLTEWLTVFIMDTVE